MPTKEDHLKKYTHKGEFLKLEKRVFATLSVDEGSGSKKQKTDLELAKVKRMQSLIFKELVEKEAIKENEIDDLLLNVALGIDD